MKLQVAGQTPEPTFTLFLAKHSHGVGLYVKTDSGDSYTLMYFSEVPDLPVQLYRVTPTGLKNLPGLPFDSSGHLCFGIGD